MLMKRDRTISCRNVGCSIVATKFNHCSSHTELHCHECDNRRVRRDWFKYKKFVNGVRVRCKIFCGRCKTLRYE